MTGDALADQIDGTPDTHLRHRAAVCDYILRHEGDFAPFMDETYSFDRYVDNMRRSGVYGGNLELVAFARNYQVDIRVYQMGGTVFVISGAPPDTPDDSNRSMPPMYIAYHSYEHYSSVRNKNGPHTGLPETKASIKKHPHSIRNPQVVGSSSLDILQGAHGSSQVELPEPTPFYSPQATSDVEEDSLSEPEPEDQPTSIEKMIMSSTGVANWKLVRRLLQKHHSDEGQVVELLIEWMGDEQAGADEWWAEDGPADYEGPSASASTALPDSSNAKHEDPASEAEPTDKPDDKSSEPEPAEKTENTKEPMPENKDRKPKAKHVKGTARQRKVESKKRQKEMARMKKRQQAAAPAKTDSSNGSQKINQIYI
ncbi:hypothetical protein EV183_000143 [Coemansia sp. RSA 2336]|nr:hypothetical protein EV183_000143 [Coemansia sp. RSA 2336]